MPSTFTTSLVLEKPASGEQDNTWGATQRSNLDILEKAITAHEAISVAGSSDVTLTTAQSRNNLIELTGALTGNINVVVPTADKFYWLYNNTSGSFTLTVKTASGTGVTVTQGAWAALYCDGTNVEKVFQNVVEGGGAFTIDANNALLVGETENGGMTVGVTINQGSNDDEIFALKSSDVAHALTGQAETDTFASIRKSVGASGGAVLRVIGEDGAITSSPVFGVEAFGFQADDTKGTTGRALIEFQAAEHDGAGAQSDLTANGNVLAVRARKSGAQSTLMILDEDGDLWLAGINADLQTYIASQVSGAASLPRSYLSGLEMSNNASALTLDVAVGECRSADDANDIALASAFSKVLAKNWTSGTGNNGLAQNATAVAAGVIYHVFAIIVSGAADIGFDSDVGGANLITDHSASAVRRIGSVIVDGAGTDIEDFTQDGDEFLWLDPPEDLSSTSITTTATTVTLTVPTGVKVKARMLASLNTGETNGVYFSPLDVDDEAATINLGGPPASHVSGASPVEEVNTRTNTSGQIRIRASGSGTDIDISTLGWIDRRGRDD